MSADQHPWVLRLRRLADLSAEDEAVLAEMTRDVVEIPPDVDLVAHGEQPERVHVVLDGLVCRYKLLPDGRRQIMAFMVPGDPCDLQIFLLSRMDHALGTLAPSRIAMISPEAMLRASKERPNLARAFWISTLIDEAILREWLVNIGRRDAYERVAHLLWELYLRHLAVGRISRDAFELPLTQQELADALGLSAVHVNRTLQRLRGEGIVEMSGRRLQVLDPEELQRISGFDPDYLHIFRAEDAPVRQRLRDLI